jgi:hypothetical protein
VSMEAALLWAPRRAACRGHPGTGHPGWRRRRCGVTLDQHVGERAGDRTRFQGPEVFWGTDGETPLRSRSEKRRGAVVVVVQARQRASRCARSELSRSLSANSPSGRGAELRRPRRFRSHPLHRPAPTRIARATAWMPRPFASSRRIAASSFSPTRGRRVPLSRARLAPRSALAFHAELAEPE